MLKPQHIFLFAALLLLMVYSPEVEAQCSMCRSVAESSYAGGSNIGKGLNDGILYLMGIPYMLLMGIGYLLFKRLRADSAETA